MIYERVESFDEIEPTIALQPYRIDFKLLVCIAIGLIFWIITIDTLSTSSLRLLGTFLALIFALIFTKYHISTLVLSALMVLVFSKSLGCELSDGSHIDCRNCSTECEPYNDGFKTVLQGFSSPISWMITSAFHIGTAFKVTKLGERISLILMKIMGSSIIGLGFAIQLTELFLGAFIPSNTARGGGIVMPIVVSLTQSLDSNPLYNNEIGQYLICLAAHSNLLVSSLYITGAASNPIIAVILNNVLGLHINFYNWIRGAFVPFLVTFTALPIVFQFYFKPNYDGNAVISNATLRLENIGPISSTECKLSIVLLAALSLWIAGPYVGLSESLIAFLTLLALIFSRVLKWNDILENKSAWDTYVWLSGMIVLAQQLSMLGVTRFIGQNSAILVSHITQSPLLATIYLSIVYFYSMFFFSSITGHAVALVEPFALACLQADGPPWLIASLLMYFSSLAACLTWFSTGSSVLYFSLGFLSQFQWLRIGLFLSVVHISIYGSVGLIWWKLLGYY